jgi:GT2 family glycosyltransferase
VRIAVITVVAGRLGHLARQQEGLVGGSELPAVRVVVAIDDPEVARALGHASGKDPLGSRVISHPGTPAGLPLAAARNAGAQAALAGGAELLIFLDVDCIPGTRLVERYRQAAAGRCRRLLCGPVAYLPPPPCGGYRTEELNRLTDFHPARPAPADGKLMDTEDHALFWSLSFGVTAAVWHELGGFCEDYTGYGGEDTDFGQVARAIGVPIRWVGGATAFHQFHPVSDPPFEHLDDILRNAAIFHRRWGWWPMQGWFAEFERCGLVSRCPESGTWLRTTRTSPDRLDSDE